jgi:hypothetical protein
MKTRSTIWQELMTISPLVAEIEPLNPFFVPEGYFGELPGLVLETVKAPSDTVFSISSANPYQVPTGYFEALPEKIMDRIRQETEAYEPEESSLLSSIGKRMPYAVPEGYFEKMSSGVTEKEELSIPGAAKFNPTFTVPEGYFESLPQKMVETVMKKEAKVIRPVFSFTLVRYAAAAVVAGLIALTAFFYLTKNPHGSETMASIDQVSDSALITYLDNQPVDLSETGNIASNADISNEDLETLFSDVPDAELQNYLTLYTDLKPVSN